MINVWSSQSEVWIPCSDWSSFLQIQIQSIICDGFLKVWHDVLWKSTTLVKQYTAFSFIYNSKVDDSNVFTSHVFKIEEKVTREMEFDQVYIACIKVYVTYN